MSALLGLLAALCWGIHDLCVRVVAQKASILTSLAFVFAFSLSFLIIAAVFQDGTGEMATEGLSRAILAGILFAVACYGLYRAFEIGPVRLVAPIVGAYPVLSTGWAIINGSFLSAVQLLAIAVVLGGVSFVSVLSDDTRATTRKRDTIMWSLLACVCFFLTFALSQSAAAYGDILILNILMRLSGLVLIFGALAVMRDVLFPDIRIIILLAIMAGLDALALLSVSGAGYFPSPEFASVVASTFGLITIVLAWLFLKEALSLSQGIAVLCVFAAIAYLAN